MTLALLGLLCCTHVRADQWVGSTTACTDNADCSSVTGAFCAQADHASLVSVTLTAPSDLDIYTVPNTADTFKRVTTTIAITADTIPTVTDNAYVTVSTLVDATELDMQSTTYTTGRYECLSVRLTWKGRTTTSGNPFGAAGVQLMTDTREWWCLTVADAAAADAYYSTDFSAWPELTARGFDLKVALVPKLSQSYTALKWSVATAVCERTDTCDSADFCANDEAGTVCVVGDAATDTIATTATAPNAFSQYSGNYAWFAYEGSELIIAGVTIWWRMEWLADISGADVGTWQTESSRYNRVRYGFATSDPGGVRAAYSWATAMVVPGASGVHLKTVTVDGENWFMLEAAVVATSWYDLTVPVALFNAEPAMATQEVVFQGRFMGTAQWGTGRASVGADVPTVKFVFRAGTCADATTLEAEWLHEARMPVDTQVTASTVLDANSDVTKRFYIPADLYDDTDDANGELGTGYKRMAIVAAARCPPRPTETWGTAAAETNPFPTINVEKGRCINIDNTMAAAWTAGDKDALTWATFFATTVAATTYAIDSETIDERHFPRGTASGTGATFMTADTFATVAEQGTTDGPYEIATPLEDDALVMKWDATFQQWILCNGVFDTCETRADTGAAGGSGISQCGSQVSNNGAGGDNAAIVRELYSSVTYLTYKETDTIDSFSWDCYDITDQLTITATVDGTVMSATRDNDPYRVRSVHVDQLTCDSGGVLASHACTKPTGADHTCATNMKALEIEITFEVDSYDGGYYVLCPWSLAEAVYSLADTDADIVGVASNYGFPDVPGTLATSQYSDMSKTPITFLYHDDTSKKSTYRITLYTACLETDDGTDTFSKWSSAFNYDYSFDMYPRNCRTADFDECDITTGTATPYGAKAVGVSTGGASTPTICNDPSLPSGSAAVWSRVGHKWHVDLGVRWHADSVDYTAITRVLNTQMTLLPAWDDTTQAATALDAMRNMRYTPAFDYVANGIDAGGVGLDDVYTDCDTLAECKFVDVDGPGTLTNAVRINAFDQDDTATIAMTLKGDAFVKNLDLYTYSVALCEYDGRAHPALVSCAAGLLQDVATDCADVITDGGYSYPYTAVLAVHGVCSNGAWDTFIGTTTTWTGTLPGWVDFKDGATIVNPISAGPYAMATTYEVVNGIEAGSMCRAARILDLHSATLNADNDWASSVMCLPDTDCRRYPAKFGGHKRAHDEFTLSTSTALNGAALAWGGLYGIKVVGKVYDCNKVFLEALPVRRALREGDDRELLGSSSSGSEEPEGTSGATVAYVTRDIFFWVSRDDDGDVSAVIYDPATNTVGGSSASSTAANYASMIAYIICGVVGLMMIVVIVFAARWCHRREKDGTGAAIAARVMGLPRKE